MCIVSKPSIPVASSASNKPLPILRNPILDGMLGNIAALRQGTSAFRIDLVNPLTIPVGGAPVGSGSGLGGSSAAPVGSGSGSGGSGGASGGGSAATPRDRFTNLGTA